MVDVIVPRTNGGGANSYLARSLDGGPHLRPGGRDLGRGVRSRRSRAPAGASRWSTARPRLRAGLFAPDGSSAATEGSTLGPFLEGRVHRHRRVRVRRCSRPAPTRGTTHAFRLGAGGDPNNLAAWQQIDPAPSGREPELAGLPGTFAVDARARAAAPAACSCSASRARAGRRPSRSSPAVNNNGFQLAGNAKGRLTAVVTYSAYRLVYITSTDGGVLWSSDVNIGNFEEYPSGLEIATNATGAGIAAVADAFGAKAVHVTRFTPRTAPVARRTIRGARVQVRSICAATEAVARRRDRARQPPGRALDRPAPRQLRQHPRRPPRLPRQVPRALHPAPPHREDPGASHPAPRQGAHAAPARPALQRDALMLELNPPNVLTLVRVALIPVLVAVLLSALPESDLLAAIVFVIASATDALDG